MALIARCDHRFLRFLAVGALNFLFGYACFALLLFAGLHYAAALFVATVMGVLFNFKTIGHFVFNSNDNRLMVRFFGSYVIVYAVNLSCLKILALGGVSPYYGGALLMLPVAILAYMLNKRFVFPNDKIA